MDARNEKPGSHRTTAGRIAALDVFRGLTIAAMILVNDPGSCEALHWPLAHAAWHGRTELRL